MQLVTAAVIKLKDVSDNALIAKSSAVTKDSMTLCILAVLFYQYLASTIVLAIISPVYQFEGPAFMPSTVEAAGHGARWCCSAHPISSVLELLRVFEIPLHLL